MDLDELFTAVNSYQELTPELKTFRQVLSSVATDQPIGKGLVKEFSELVKSAHVRRRLATSPESSRIFSWELSGVRGEKKTHLEYALMLESLLASPEIERVKECLGPWCNALFLDHSKNSSRGWCLQAACEQLRKREKARKFYNTNRKVTHHG